MLYENFDTVQAIVKEIDKAKETQEKLEANYLLVRVVPFAGIAILEIEVATDSRDEIKDIADQFILNLIAFYENKINTLTKKLKEL